MTRTGATPKTHSFARFRVVREIGRGGQGAVLEALDLERDARVAIKTLRAVGADEIARIKSEFRAVRDLRHPNLVRLGELIEEDGRWFFTMELVDGTDLLSHVRAAAALEITTSWPSCSVTRVDSIPLPELRSTVAPAMVSPADRCAAAFDEVRLRRSLAQLTSALAYLHAAGKVHRDLKPSNVLVDATGRTVLIDFGVAGAMGDEEEGEVVGTVPYMAPEQMTGDAVGPAADWYSVGVILFEGLTGRRPFEGSAREVMERKSVGEAPRPSDFVREVPPDLEALCVRLLARDPRDRATGEDVARMMGLEREEGAGEVPFVGRQSELGELAHAYEDVLGGGLVAVVLEGESGVGKSALAQQFASRLRTHESRPLVLRGRCHEHESVPYNAFDAVIDGLARHLRVRKPATVADLFPPHMDRVRTLFPTMGHEGDVEAEAPPSGSPDPYAVRDEAFIALRELFRRVGERWPVVLLLEDVQWADVDSRALLDALTRPPRAPRMLVVATARAAAGGGPCPALRAIGGDLRRVALGGLGMGEARALVNLLLARSSGRVSIDGDAIIQSTHGHPMFMEELVRYLSRPRERRGAVLLDEALRARTDELDEDARAVLSVVAAAGAPTEQGAIAAAARVPFATYADIAAALHEAKLVRVRGARPDDEVEPFHDRVREAVYAGLSLEARASIHGSLARALEARSAGPELLFHHFAAAGEASRAVDYAELAAAAVARALAFDRSIELYRAALALGAKGAAHRRRLLTLLAERLIDAGRSKEAAESFLEASATGNPVQPERLDLVRRAAERFLMSGHTTEGLAATNVVLDAAGLTLPVSWLGAIARFGWYRLRLSRRDLTWTRRRPEDVDPVAAMRMDLCWSVSAGLGLVDSIRSMLFVARGALECLEHGDDARIARALAVAAVAEAGLVRRVDAARLGAACRQAAEADGSDRSRFYVALVTMTDRFFLANEWPACLAAGREAQRLWRSSGRTEGWEVDIVDQFSCWALDNAGRFAELAERVPAKIKAAQSAGNRFVEVNFRTEFVNIRLVRDRPAEARREVEDAIAAWPRTGTDFGNQHYLALRGLTSVALYEGDEHTAAALVPQWRRYFASLLSRVPFLRMDALWNVGAIALVRAFAARAKGRTTDVAARLREARRARDGVARIDLPYARANGMQLQAAIAALEGDLETEVRSLRAGIDDADARGAELHAAAMRARLGGILGGTEGGALARASEAWARREQVRDPGRLFRTVLPVTGS